MTARWSVECNVCKKKKSFEDEKDISNAKWTILAWIVPSGEPLCVCDACEYNTQPKVNNNKKDVRH